MDGDIGGITASGHRKSLGDQEVAPSGRALGQAQGPYREKPPTLTIAIPSYNRPWLLKRLLESLDCDGNGVEVLISDDNSPLLESIDQVIRDFTNSSDIEVTVCVQDRQLGYDGNLRFLFEKAQGRFTVVMGDDDEFVPGAISKLVEKLRAEPKLGYLLRSYETHHPNGVVESLRYLPESQLLPPGEKSVAWLFKRSVSISGFTIRTECAQKFATGDLDGSLLYQLYLMAMTSLRHSTLVWNEPIAIVNQTFRSGSPAFGTAESESSRFTPGLHSPGNSLTFTRGFLEVAAYIDDRQGTHLVSKVQRQISVYSYPFLSIQRKNGLKTFWTYSQSLRALGVGDTWHFQVYRGALAVLGERVCDRLILFIKRRLGYTPNLG